MIPLRLVDLREPDGKMAATEGPLWPAQNQLFLTSTSQEFFLPAFRQPKLLATVPWIEKSASLAALQSRQSRLRPRSMQLHLTTRGGVSLNSGRLQLPPEIVMDPKRTSVGLNTPTSRKGGA
ncbi:hypothetical protein NDU88_005422 [Pleurodeles waltl]|uniref:Uncharacterized protein n=1 Tax=Pleurodeles waltl TaxID=8319 RepID=A0AAV7SLL7_PLEWA|nr:hypothetical protein NDU88_005422 [Pleurodeles waltl]